MSVFKDTRALADQVVKMVDAILAKQQPEVNNTKDYNNGVKVVPSYLLEPKFVDKSNYKQLLIDSGYYTEAELQKQKIYCDAALCRATEQFPRLQRASC